MSSKSTYQQASKDVAHLASNIENIVLSGQTLAGGKKQKSRKTAKSKSPVRKTSRKSSKKVARKSSKKASKRSVASSNFADSLISLGLQMKSLNLDGQGKKPKAHKKKAPMHL